ncbi:MAG: TIGR04211 family SH3 domain-containing protein [Gammaproteobacteria bacterium]|nr:TIGR04211 family SH3 domain-containing protein [Gammaproteobacteria bacterium]
MPVTSFLRGLALLLLTSSVFGAELVFISDLLYVQLRAAPRDSARILHAGLRSGTELELLGTDLETGFSHVRMNDGTDGWIPSQYLVAQPIASDRLAATERRLANLQRENNELSTEVDTLSRENVELRQHTETLATEVIETTGALEELTSISSSSLKLDRQSTAVNELNALLRRQVDELVTENQALSVAAEQRWMLTGLGLLVLGIVLGLLVARRKRGW